MTGRPITITLDPRERTLVREALTSLMAEHLMTAAEEEVIHNILRRLRELP